MAGHAGYSTATAVIQQLAANACDKIVSLALFFSLTIPAYVMILFRVREQYPAGFKEIIIIFLMRRMMRFPAFVACNTNQFFIRIYHNKKCLNG